MAGEPLGGEVKVKVMGAGGILENRWGETPNPRKFVGFLMVPVKPRFLDGWQLKR